MASEPLYARIAAHLARDIARNRYKVGDLLPTEHQLAASHQVSRQTIRSALAELESRQLVSRRKNVGTRVEATRTSGGYVQSLGSVNDLVQWAQQNQREVLQSRTVVLDQALAKTLGCEPGSRWILVQSLRFEEGTGLSGSKRRSPIAWTDAYIEERHRAVIPTVRETPSALMSDLLEQRFGVAVSAIEQEVSATLLATEVATKLKAEPGEPALKVMRRYLDSGGRPFLVTVSTHPADRFHLNMLLKRI